MSQTAASNQLHGTIPTQIGQLYSLTFLDLSFNNLSGTVPTFLAALTKLGELDLSSVYIMNVLDCSYNLLTFLLPHLETLYLSNNPNLTGNLTAIFCYRSWGVLEADCSSGNVECLCCTKCY
jgi:Leucine-rich repeat (LRR) protein